ncbi:MAG: hypothetical protein LBD62_01785 [Candidatus Margulisbacteria bacterium]|nr:hypothetical protein [Candidatus Margulisiibacteriota bacterium]
MLSIIKYTGNGVNQQHRQFFTENTEDFFYTDIVLDKDGYIYIVATFISNAQKIRVFRSNAPRDITAFTEEICTSNAWPAAYPKLSVDPANNVYLTYELHSTWVVNSPKQIAVHKRIKVANSGVWSPAAMLAQSFRAQHPDAVFHNGKLYLVYSEQVNNINENCVLHYLVYDKDDLSVLDDKIVLSEKKIYSPRLSFSGDTPLIQYVGSADGSVYQVKMTAGDASGSVWSAPQILSDASNAVYVHNVADVVADTPDVLWYNTSDEKVYFANKIDIPDLVPPANGSVIINGGEALTKNPALQLTLFATDAGSGLAEMNISETSAFSAIWQPYATSLEYTLIEQTPNQEKTIYVWYKDHAGNISATISASIELTDAGGSGGAVKINSDTPYTNTRNVTLTFSNNHALAYDMRVSDDATAKWVSVNTTLAWTLPSGDGTKMISVEYRNQAGNVTWNGAGDSIELDTTAPAGSLEINEGETATDNAVFKLKLTASADTVSMNINETDAWSIWQNYSIQTSYALLDTATGNKTVYVWLKDRAGNISATISAGIILEDTAGNTVPDLAAPAANVPVGKKIYAYPNPAQPRKEDITIAYSADKDSAVNIYLYNILGEKIWSASGYARVGAKNEVIWNGRDAYGSEAGNGVYILLLTDERKKILARGRLTILDD